MAKSNSKITGYAFGHIGASKMRSYEDRHYFSNITTKGGLDITLAIVSDGVGGGNFGQRAAQLTVETVVKEIKDSNKAEDEIIPMLGNAVGCANKAVYQEAASEKEKFGMSATISVALVYKSKLYVANVGDSRIYLIRNGVAKQITLDHTYANEKIRQGILKPEEAFRHPHAESLTRSIGFEPQVLVDLGLYVNNGQEDSRTAYANQGLELGVNDVILVCSDGLVKVMAEYQNRHYVEVNEIVEIVTQYHAEEAAKVLNDLAIGRNVDDNVTVVVIEFVNRKTPKLSKSNIFLLSIMLLLVTIILIFLLLRLVV